MVIYGNYTGLYGIDDKKCLWKILCQYVMIFFDSETVNE